MSEISELESIRNWVSEQGYPFELHAGREFRRAGWNVDHAQFYADPETGKSREIDLIASTHAGDSALGAVVISLAIECKTSTKPWVVFTSKQKSNQRKAIPQFFAPGAIGGLVMVEAMKLGSETPIFQPPARLGHGVVRAHGNNTGTEPMGPYAALLGATSAAVALEHEKVAFWMSHSEDLGMLTPYIPIVAFDGNIYEIELTSGGDELITQVERSVVWCRTPGTASDPALVHLVSRASLSEFAHAVFSDAQKVAEEALKNVPLKWAKFRKGPLAKKYGASASAT